VGGKNSAPINEIVALSKSINGLEHGALAGRYQGIAKDLAGGIEAGETDEALTVLREKGQFAIDVLDSLIPRCRWAILECQTRLRFEGRLRTAGQIVSLVGTSAIVGSLGFQETGIALVTGIITLISSVLVVLADFLGSAPGGRKIDVQAAYERLNNAVLDSSVLVNELRVLLKYGGNPQELLTKIAEINALSRSVNKDVGLLLLNQFKGAEKAQAGATDALLLPKHVHEPRPN
jgi:hypothetical protein